MDIFRVGTQDFETGLGILFPDAVVHKLNLRAGQAIFLVEQEGGTYLLTTEKRLAQKMEKAEGVLKRYHNALKDLA